MKNNKGFTLIELLAVIVILGILLAIAIPSVAKYINTARKSTYIENVQSYARAAKNEVLMINSNYQLPVNNNEATVISFKMLEKALENGGITSSYGGTYTEEYSYVTIVNDETAEEPHYTYYISALDSKGYGIATKASTYTADAIAYDSIKESNIAQLTATGGITYEAAATANNWTIKNVYTSTKTIIGGVEQ